MSKGVKGVEMSGRISDRIRSKEIPDDSLSSKRLPVDNSPSTEAIQAAHGEGLGDTTRSDPSAGTHEE